MKKASLCVCVRERLCLPVNVFLVKGICQSLERRNYNEWHFLIILHVLTFKDILICFSSPQDRVPFAVVGSNRVIEVGGKRVRGRQYPWGIVEVENLEHNDFIALRNMVIR